MADCNMSVVPSSAFWSPSVPHPVTLSSAVDYVRAVVDQALAARSAFSHQVEATIPGLRVTVNGIGGPIETAAAHNLVAADEHGPLPPVDRLDVFIAHAGIEGMSPPAIWSEEEAYSPHRLAQLLAAVGLRASFFGDLSHWHILDMERRVAVELMTGPADFPPWEPGAPLRPFLHWLYAERGMRLSHAGTLGVDGTGVLLAGAGGSGKSGTVIGGLMHGLQSVGDDYVLLSLDDGIRAFPVFSTLKQDPEGFARLGLAARVDAGELNWQGKHQFRLDEISRVPVPAELKIGAMLVPRVAHVEKTTISPIARTDAMIALAASSIYQMPGERESGFRFFGEVTKRLPCFRLDLGRNPAEISDTITGFIASIKP